MTEETDDVSLVEAQKIVDEMTAPKVTQRTIEGKIDAVDYLYHGTLTICIITMQNGFMQVGSAAPASPQNFSSEVGRRFAYEDAFRNLWRLEGYLMREQLAEEEDIREIQDAISR